MKITLYAATSIDGFIAKKDGDSNWVSALDTEIFNKKIAERGCLVLGNRTFKQFEGELYPVKGVANMVLTSEPGQKSKYDNVFYCASTQEVVSKAAAQGHDTILLVGGSKTNAAFLKEDLIDEIFVTIHPLILGEGLPLFANTSYAKSLELVESTSLGQGLLQAYYRVVK